MIQEAIFFTMGLLIADAVKQYKITKIIYRESLKLEDDMEEAEEMQKEFREKGGSVELTDRQIQSTIKLERRIAVKETLEKFNYFIW